MRVFSRDAALQRVTIKLDVILRRTACGLDNRFALSDQNLGTHDVDACDLFCDRMLDLDARIYFDEKEFSAVHIHQEFDGTRTFIIHMLADFLAQLADLLALGF